MMATKYVVSGLLRAIQRRPAAPRRRAAPIAGSVLALSAVLAAGCHSAPPVASAPPPWLEAKIGEVATSAVPGAVPVGPPYKGVAYDKGGRTDWKLGLEAGKCYSFVAVGDETVEKLALYLWDPKDWRVTQDKAAGPTSVVTHCVEVPGLYRFQAKVTEGAGHYGVGVFATAAAPKAAPPPPPPEPAKQDLSALVEAEAGAVAPGATRVGNYFTGNADKSDWYTAMDVGKCYWIVGIGGTGIDELYLYLWDSKDKRITENKAKGSKSNMGHCPTTSGMFHFQAKVNSGSGDYAVGVYAKPK